MEPHELSRGSYRASDVFRALHEAGWAESRISGSHHIFSRAGCRCLPIAVHGGRLRRDVVQYVMRQARLATALDDGETAMDTPVLADVSDHALQAESAAKVVPASVLPAETRKWAEASAEEQARLRERAERAEELRAKDVRNVQAQLDAAQVELLAGNYAEIDVRLTPLLSDGCETLARRCGYEIVADALFFLTTALCNLATAGGRAAFDAPAQQQQVVRAFDACKQLLELRDRRADAKTLMSNLLSWAYRSYVGELLTLAASQQLEEFKDADVLGHTLEILSAESEEPPHALIGKTARIEGLKSKPELNGRHGQVESYVAANERFQVTLDSGGVRESVLVRRANLRVDGQSRHASALVGGLSDRLDRINLSLLSGFSFISGLACSDKNLIIAATHAEVSWPRQGIVALARAAITHYERGHLSAACEAFEAIDFACTHYAAVFDEQQEENWRLMDAFAPGVRQARVMGGSGAEEVLGSATTLRHLARACLRMRPAHEHAAHKMSWSRCHGFSADSHGFSASEPMRLGWANVFEAAAAERRAAAPLSGAELSKFMSLFFDGYEYSVEHQDALRTGTATMFVAHNLADPVRLIMHQCSQLHQTSNILSGALQALDKGTVIHGRANARLPPNWKDQIARSEHQGLRLQLVTMIQWIVHLRALFHRMDDMVETQMTNGSDGGSMVSVRLDELFHATKHLQALIHTCCQYRHQSTLIDILNETLSFQRALDYHRYLPAFGGKPWFSSLDPGLPMELSKALFVTEICNHLPLFLRWFTASVTERQSLAVKYGLIQTLKGFDLRTCDGGRLAAEQVDIRDAGHDGRFSARALEMLVLLGRVGDATPAWEVIADAVLALRAEANGGTAVPSRQARRSADVQKHARRIGHVISSIRVRYPHSEAEDMCERRLRHYGALLDIIDKFLSALRVARPAADGEGEGMMKKSKLAEMGKLMPDFTAHDLYEINMHTVALTELATEVNRRMREVFGGNFPALVWQTDCYEYDPAHAHKQMEPILEGQARLAEAVVVLARVVADAGAKAVPEAKARTEAPSAAEPPAEEPAGSGERSKSSRRRGGKKGGKKAAQAAGEEAQTTTIDAEQLEVLAAVVAHSTIEEQD